MKILVINGPNLNMLGIREPGIYGKNTFADLLRLLDETASAEGLEVEQYQSNHEGDLVTKSSGHTARWTASSSTPPPIPIPPWPFWTP